MAELVALLDFGSNAARFLLAKIEPGVGFRVLTQTRARTRLGAGADGLLSPSAVLESVSAAERFIAQVRAKQPRLLAVATAAVRDSGNAESLAVRVRALGAGELRLLSGVEEARLGAEAVLCRTPLRSGTVVDLGGGSLQLTQITRGKLGEALSLPLGATRLTREFLLHDPPTLRELQRLREATRAQLQAAIASVQRPGPLIVLGGTPRALARRRLREGDDRPKKRHAATLQHAELRRLRARLQSLSIAQRRCLRGMKAERADIVVSAAIVLEELLALTGHDALTVSQASVREGVLWRETRSYLR
jgi:exopolyphosphatase/guanosine-5'-triphosphate,3'-diphosphate pyrophosphatase